VKIITVGAAIQDVFLSNSPELTPVCTEPDKCFNVLELGSKADVNSIFYSTGGGATNSAVTFARQGFDTYFMGVIGRDPAGQAVLEDLDRENINTKFLRYSDTYGTGYSVLLLAPNGERTILTYRGASTHYRLSDMNLGDEQADWLYVTTLSGAMNVLNQLFSQAKKNGMRICFNPGKKELAKIDELRGLLTDVDVLLTNKEEMSQIVHGDSLETLVRHALNLVPTAVVTDGANGAIASDGKTVVRAGLYTDEKTVDRTGAGDAFGSGFLSQWAMDSSLKESVIFASANASSVTGQMGSKTGILYKGVKLHEMPISETAV